MRPAVSVIVPCYKVERYLGRCVDSIRSQTLKDIEIILVDDGSPDNCPQLCDEYAKIDNRIKVVHKHNAGLGMACNSGLEVATGEYVAFCDSDDYVDSDCYEKLYDAAKKTGSDAVYSGIKRVDENGVVTPMSKPAEFKTFEGKELESFQLGMIATEPHVNTERNRQMSAKIVLYSHDLIRNNNVRFKSERDFVSEDLLFNLDFLQHTKMVTEYPEAFYYYFINTSSLSQSLRKDRFEKYKVLRLFLLENYDFADCEEKLLRIDKMFIGYVRSAMRQIVVSNECHSEKRRLLSEICRDNIWNALASEFPVNKLPFAKKIAFRLTQYNMPSLLYLLFRI